MDFALSEREEGFRRELQTSGETMIRIIAINAESGVLFESKYELDELLNQGVADQLRVVLVPDRPQGNAQRSAGAHSA